jgi:REP element-mobilizing transposase RayT
LSVFAVVGWLDVFTRNDYKDILLQSLSYCQKVKGIEIIAWCDMTNHVHLVFRSVKGPHPSLLLGDFKRFTSRAVVKAMQENPRERRRELLLEQFKKAAAKSSNVKEYMFWRHDNKPIELWSNKVIWEKINYVHNNPVEKGLMVLWYFSIMVEYGTWKTYLKLCKERDAIAHQRGDYPSCELLSEIRSIHDFQNLK